MRGPPDDHPDQGPDWNGWKYVRCSWSVYPLDHRETPIIRKVMFMGYAYDHLHLRSPDPEAAAAAYVAWFGATIKDRVRMGAGLRVVVDLDGLLLFIEEVPAQTPTTPPAPFVGMEHIGLRVGDLDTAAADLRRKGVKFLVEPTSPRPGVKVAFIEGPDAIRIEILQRDAA
jgi:catechol 2,3-dioxygenase-like lactoylglutathione lyase family enzyme